MLQTKESLRASANLLCVHLKKWGRVGWIGAKSHIPELNYTTVKTDHNSTRHRNGDQNCRCSHIHQRSRMKTMQVSMIGIHLVVYLFCKHHVKKKYIMYWIVFDVCLSLKWIVIDCVIKEICNVDFSKSWTAAQWKHHGLWLIQDGNCYLFASLIKVSWSRLGTR